MSKKVPYNTDYELVEKNESLSQFILYSSILVSLLGIFIEKSNLPYFKGVSTQVFISINSFLSICYYLSDIASNYLFQSAEAKRRNDFFDNSLNTKLSEEISEEYFTNEHIAPGITKLGVNSFENSFFTKSIAKEMFKPMLLKSISVLLVFIAIALFTDSSWLAFALQFALPFTIVHQTIRLYIFRKRVEYVFQNFQQIFSSAHPNHHQQLIIHNVASYETSLAWACIKLDSKLFNKMNGELSEKWQNIKQRLNL
ncbi:MAG: ABC transporter ATP-binding protein [Bacteroidetes bacterium]|nr:ABC transporter ATP-binding protein [Bacteroidota bacterium]